MAEHANRGVQKSVKEFEQLAQLKIFSTDSLKDIIKKHNDFEYKLRRRGKSEKVFFDYIDYKIKLLELCRVKMQDNMTSSIHKFHTENTIKNHIKKLFKTCTKLFPHMTHVWNKYIEFLKSENMNADIMHAYTGMLRYHNNPTIYIQAADFASNVCFSIDRARKYLMEALHVYPQHKKLYLSLFELELSRTKQKWTEYEAETLVEGDPVLHGLVAEGVFRAALEKFPNDLDLLFPFFFHCRKCEILQKLPLIIYREIKDNNKTNPNMWDRIAKLQLAGMDCESDDDQIKLITSRKGRTMKCLDVYADGLKETNNSEEMWDLYLTTVFDIPLAWFNAASADHYLKEISKRPFDIKKLKPGHFLSWLRLLKFAKKDEEHEVVLDIAFKTYPENQDILLNKLENRKSNDRDISKIFQSSFEMNGFACSTFWEDALMGMNTCSEFEIDLITREFIKDLPLVKLMAHMFLDWSHSRGGIKKARFVFEMIKGLVSENLLELYWHMIRLEESSPDSNIEQLEKYYEEALNKFGISSDKLWLSYIQLQNKIGKSKLTSSLYWKALKTLKPNMADKFTEKFSLWKISQYGKNKTT